MQGINPAFQHAIVEDPMEEEEREMTGRLSEHYQFVSQYLHASKEDRLMTLEQMRADFGRFTLMPDNNFREFVVCMLYDILEKLDGVSASEDHQRQRSRKGGW